MLGGITAEMMVLLITIFVIFSWEFGIGILTSERTAIRAAEVQGFTNIRIIDKAIVLLSWRGCSSSDAARFSVEAKNAQGYDVEFYVCTGFLKGSTIPTK